MKHPDGTFTDDVNADFITQEFGAEYKNYVETASSSASDVYKRQANKVSHLHTPPNLIKLNAPKVRYVQEENMDLCIPKAFASVLHYVGFCAAAKEINDKFHSREYCYGIKDTNFKAISSFAVQVLPSWLQIRSKNINEFNWQLDLDQFDIFVAGLVGTDGIANHAIAIYNNWIFDGNEKLLYHCVRIGSIIV